MRAYNYDYLIGTKINKLTVLKYIHENHRTYAICKCECGNECKPTMQALLSGHSKSCGCISRERIANQNYKHGMSNQRLYKTYHSMVDRCNNPNLKNYKDYGGRGIKVCDDWKTFESFKDWALANGYSNVLTLDRIDVNGNYEPSNCRWANNRVQNLNKRNTVRLTFNGITKTLVEWGELSVCGVQAFRGRIQSGWDIARALAEPLHQNYSNKKLRTKQREVEELNG